MSVINNGTNINKKMPSGMVFLDINLLLPQFSQNTALL
jgi:hypothetical protein